MDKFGKAELTGRLKLEEIFKHSNKTTDYEFTPDRFCPVDVLWENKDNYKFVGEIKYRYYPSYTKFFSTEGFVLEKFKYDSLISYYDRTNRIPLYINFTTDNKCIIFDVRQIKNPNWFEKEYPKDSQDNKDEKVIKIVTNLPIQYGKIFDLNKLYNNWN